MSEPIIVKSKPEAILRVCGEDAQSFLHNQGTQDLQGNPGFCRYCLWLDHKGLVHGDSFVLKTEEAQFLLVSYFTSGAALKKKLENHIVADEVEIEDAAHEFQLTTLIGKSAEILKLANLETMPEETMFLQLAKGIAFRGRRGVNALEFLHASDIEVVDSSLQVRNGCVKDLELLRIENRIPAVPCDIGPEETPLAGGLEENSISFEKGCYLGQEVVARMHRLQRTPVRLVSLKGNGIHVSTDTRELYLQGQQVGSLRTFVQDGDAFLGLGIVKSRCVEKGIKLTLGEDGPELEAEACFE